MEENVKRLYEIHNLCTWELQRLQNNVTRFLQTSNLLMTSFVNNNMYNSNIISNETVNTDNKCFSTFSDMTKEASTFNSTITTKIKCALQLIDNYQRNITCKSSELDVSEIKAMYEKMPDEPTFLKSTQETKINVNTYEYLPKKLSMYPAGKVINGYVTYIEDLENLLFYIVDKDINNLKILHELSKNSSLEIYKEFPAQNVIFGLESDNIIIRAMYNKFFDFDANLSINSHKVLLVDYGEKIEINASTITYKLPKKYRQVEAQVLYCKLSTEGCNIEDLKNQLHEALMNTKTFVVKGVENNMLCLNLQQATNPFIENSINKVKKSKVLIPDTKESINNMSSLFQEEISTDNASVAVLGFESKDDQNLCNFYNPKTDGCFKGKHCNKIHKLKQADGYTKDIMPAANIYKYLNEKYYDKNSIISVQPTCIEEFEKIYCNVIDLTKSNKPFIWNNEEISNTQRLKSPPVMHEIVLGKYVDGFWYRARIVDVDLVGKLFKIFYIDYGNTQLVDLEKLAHCEEKYARQPDLAILCRLANIKDVSETEEQRQCGIDLLIDIFLNEMFSVKVIHHYEDLTIEFLDKNAVEVFEKLKNMKCIA